MRLLAVIGAVLIVAIAGITAYIYLGYYDISATSPHIDLVREALDLAMEKSVEQHAGEVATRPSLDNPELVKGGIHHYIEQGCFGCHGAPGRRRAEFAEQMSPKPPDLSKAASQWSDAELFWIVKHGIKMTGMPAFGPSHSDEELWQIVALVRRLPHISATEFAQLSGAAAEGDHGGEAGAEAGHGAAPKQHRP